MGGGPAMLILLIVLYPDHARVLAQVADPAGQIVPWLNLGATVMFLYLFTTGRIVAQSTHQRCEEKLAAAEAELRERNREDRVTHETLRKATELFARYLDRQGDTPNPPPKGRG